MSEIPSKDEETIDADHEETLIIPIANILYSGDRPWYTKNQIKNRLREEYNQDPSKPTITGRLDTLLDLELVERKRIGQTDIYFYLKGSEWPIPPDVSVEPTDDELTVTEFISRQYVQWAGISIFSILVGGIIVWTGTLQSSGLISLPFEASETLAVGLLSFIISYILMLLAVVIGILDISVGADIPDWLR